MLLAIDIGNTNIVFALFEETTLRASWRMTTQATRTADEYAVFLSALMMREGLTPQDVHHAIIGSVVSAVNPHIIRLCETHFSCTPLIVGAPDAACGVPVLLDHPEEVGADRIINAVGGLARFPAPLLIIDFGTATTFDVVDAQGAYIGGAIAPGINLSAQALHMAAAKLPRIDIVPPQKVIGTNTVEAMRSGVYWGYVGLIEGMIARIKEQVPQSITVIATGGLASLFKENVPAIQEVCGDLTLQGLRLIFERNKNNT